MSPTPERAEQPLNDTQATGPIAVVGLGASAGGLPAYTEFLEALPAATGMAFVVVQHLAAGHESMLATILARSTPMRVIEVVDEALVEPNTVYVIPPDRSILILDGRLSLIERAPGVPRAIDIFLTALAESLGHRAIGVVFSGTGSDGTMGLEAIKAAGGITFAQDTSALHDGMPQSAIDSGCVDYVLPARAIALELARLAASPDFASGTYPPAEGLQAILDIIRDSLNVDFSQYKVNTLQRRVRRRMDLLKAPSFEDYQTILKSDPKEVQALHQDILISVTNFFRDPDSFEAVKQSLFPRIFARDKFEEPIRVWVLGCSTGEEAYSFAILLQEYMLEQKRTVPVVIFATDINNVAIEKARRGWYPKSIAQDVSASRLMQFFIEVDGGYIVAKPIRDLCVFARHNALTDPPFSRIDLVSCRNMLIYLQAGLQRRLLPVLHYALKPQGFMFLGPSETISHHLELFEVDDARHKFYSKRMSVKRLEHLFPVAASGALVPAHIARKYGTPFVPAVDMQREVDRATLKHYAPVCVVVDPEGEVLQFRGDTELYLTQGDGKASLNLFKMARDGLLGPLRSLMQRMKEGAVSAREEDITVSAKSGLVTVSLNVIAVTGKEPAERCFGIFFEPQGQHAANVIPTPSRRAPKAQYIENAERQNRLLTQELSATREYLESTIELLQASNEEMQSANEEVQSTNEELQSSNEELETSKEEIQSSNEELTTVNEELRGRNQDLDRANNDLNNLFGSVQMAVVMVWRDLHIRRYTPLAQKLFNLVPADIGRSIGDMHLNLELEDFSGMLQNVIDQGVATETEVRSRDGHSYLLRIRPYKTDGNQIDGAVIVLIDIDMLSRTQESLRKRIDELADADRYKSEFLAILAHELRNPLAPLRNAVQILKMSPADEDVSAKARDLIERQVKHMSRMVNDLLDAARAERGQIKLQLETLDLRTVVERAAENMRPQFAARRQAFALHLPDDAVVIAGDATRLDQILMNLLSNANKYTAERGTIEMRLEPPDPRSVEPLAVVRVRDDGQGIDPQLIPRLFDLFAQADRSLAHSQGGLGIGLSLVRTLIELHGGSVSAHSDGPNLGSEFVLRIPVSVTAAGKSPADPVAAPAPPPVSISHKILIVDDNADINESSEVILKYAGHVVRTASTGREALAVAEDFHPDVILLDIGLPDMSGYEVAKRLRSMDAFSTVRLIAISGYDTALSRARSTEAGFDFHVCKPVDFATLEALFRQ